MLKSREVTSRRCSSRTGLVGQEHQEGQRHRDRLHAGEIDATRTAALLSGELDFVLDPPRRISRGCAADTRSRWSRGGEPHHLPRSTSSATNCCLPTSRARTRSRTCACAGPVPRDQHRGDPEVGDARFRPIPPAPSSACRQRWTKEAHVACRTTEEGARAADRRGYPNGSRSRWTARTTATSTTRRSARRW